MKPFRPHPAQRFHELDTGLDIERYVSLVKKLYSKVDRTWSNLVKLEEKFEFLEIDNSFVIIDRALC